ncbi:MAG: heavy-metal-associated domain-containing protein [Myxococcales bacterium]|nr:heavy-metal-associated domain-containing protein [Myxococcales bacterium]
MEETWLIVEGMSCPSCIRHIDGALKGVDGVEAVDVRLREGKVLVRHRGVMPADLARAVEAAGYGARADR